MNINLSQTNQSEYFSILFWINVDLFNIAFQMKKWFNYYVPRLMIFFQSQK